MSEEDPVVVWAVPKVIGYPKLVNGQSYRTRMELAGGKVDDSESMIYLH